MDNPYFKDNLDPRIKKIVEHYGTKSQCGQAIEECGELIVALCKLIRYGVRNWDLNRQNVIGEIADVKVMIEQLEYILGCRDEVEKVMNQKLDRQIRRINDENPNFYVD